MTETLADRVEALDENTLAVAGGWFGMMSPGKGELTFHLNTSKPTAFAQAALDKLVREGLVSVEPFNPWGGLVYEPLVDFQYAKEWLFQNRGKDICKQALTEQILDEQDAKEHQEAALRARDAEEKG